MKTKFVFKFVFAVESRQRATIDNRDEHDNKKAFMLNL